MKGASQKEVHEITEQYETTAEFLEDLAARADSNQKKERCLATARNFRLVAQSTVIHKRSKGGPQPNPSRNRSSSGGQHG
jgi:hypothetical protein